MILELRPKLINENLVFSLDEIQQVPGWEKFCRRAVEREGIKVYLIGSSSRVMPLEIHTALKVRAWSIEVFPFPFKEILTVQNLDIHDPELLYGKQNIVLNNLFAEYLKWGGFPEIVLAITEFEKKKLLKEYLSAMFFIDLIERYAISNIPLLKNLNR